jgi:hypothetical protein
MQGLKGKSRGRAAVLVLLVAPTVFADDTDPAARISPPIGSQESIPLSDEPTVLDLVWLWITTFA